MIKLKHIGFIVSHYPHLAFGHDGGLGTSVYNLVQSLKTKFEVSVFVYGQEKYFEIVETNMKIYSLNFKSDSFGFYKTRKKINQFVNKKIQDDDIQLIEVPDWTGISAFMSFPVPVVMRFHGSDAYFCHLENRKQKWKNFLFEKLAVSAANAFIAPTGFSAQLSKEIFRIKNKEIRTIHYGLRLNDFNNPESENFKNFQILYIGTLIRKKGVLELPFILQKIILKFPETRLIIIGSDAPDIETGLPSTWGLLKKQFGSAIKNVTYLGKIPYHLVQENIKESHVCIFPSYAETLGMVTIESMALKKAVVNTNIGWAKEIIDNGVNGLMAYPDDHESFSDHIMHIFSDDIFRKKIQSNARLKVESHFDIEKKTLENIEFYEEIINAKDR
ncbi:glycosyltransferase family 4 protein [Zunongwangia sp.]|uniref:glycosyltransferase family 4 protein n=1 Tax=Zunongwangia sp. TaxID=1965325 RepID=UPI003AA944B0